MNDYNENVLEKVCEERHKAVDDRQKAVDKRLNENSRRIDSVEDAVIKLTNMVEAITKRDIFDKMIILSVFFVCLVLAGIVLGPEIVARLIGSVK